jgi:hypothetical protein
LTNRYTIRARKPTQERAKCGSSTAGAATAADNGDAKTLAELGDARKPAATGDGDGIAAAEEPNL